MNSTAIASLITGEWGRAVFDAAQRTKLLVAQLYRDCDEQITEDELRVMYASCITPQALRNAWLTQYDDDPSAWKKFARQESSYHFIRWYEECYQCWYITEAMTNWYSD